MSQHRSGKIGSVLVLLALICTALPLAAAQEREATDKIELTCGYSIYVPLVLKGYAAP